MCIASDMYRKYLPSFALSEPANVLDLGANGGGFPLMLRIEEIEMALAVCVEMNPLTYLRLQLNLTTNLRSSAIAINAAVCGMPQDSNILLKPSRGSTGESMYNNRADSSTSHVSVRTTTFQCLCDKYFKNQVVDICKIDIEGAEYELFESTPDDVVRRIRYLIIEFHDSSKTPALMRRIADLGFCGHNVGAKSQSALHNRGSGVSRTRHNTGLRSRLLRHLTCGFSGLTHLIGSRDSTRDSTSGRSTAWITGVANGGAVFDVNL